MIETERLERTFIELLQLNSPSKRERNVADYVKAKLIALGFEVEEDDAGARISGDAGNIIAFKQGTVGGAKGIFLCCHLDTVEPTDRLTVVVEDNIIHSDGSTILGADDKAGVAAVLEAVESISESATPHGDIQVLFNVSEEIGLLGARALDRSKIKAKLGYVLDTGKPVAGITISAPSHENLLVEISGTSSHAGIAPERGVSAIVAASRAIARMNLGRIDEETTANVGTIEGGKARNIVPNLVTVKAEARSRDEAKLVAQVQHMKTVFEEEAAAMGAKALVKHEREYTGYRLSQQDEVVKLAAEASAKIGIEPSYHEGGGGSDANVFNSVGIPSVVIGVGYDNPHGTSEFIELDDLVKAARFAEALVQCAAESKE